MLHYTNLLPHLKSLLDHLRHSDRASCNDEWLEFANEWALSSEYMKLFVIAFASPFWAALLLLAL